MPDSIKGILDTEERRPEDYSFPKILSAIKSKEKPKPGKPTGFKRIYMGREPQGGTEPKSPERSEEQIEAEREAQRRREQKIRQEAYAQGLTDGERQANEAAAKRIEAALAALDQAAAQFTAELGHCRSEIEQEVVALSLAITKKIIGRRIEADKDLVVETTRKALEAAPSLKAATVRIHPDEYEIVRQSVSSEAAYGNLVFEPDPRVAKGGCILETLTGEVDAAIASQLEVVEEAFKALTVTGNTDAGKEG